jgi:thiol-disulfide isomerase/thioredoxin
MSKKYFPIQTDTACLLKWSWTTLYLNSGFSSTCHRTAFHPLTDENFNDFHNTPVALDDRQQMLQGQWPKTSCGYCRKIEESGGISDRMQQLHMSDLVPVELETNPTAINVSPTIVEVYFNNTCNLGCLYCRPTLSSSINDENRRHGTFSQNGVTLQALDGTFKDLVPSFWKWFDHGFSTLKRFHVLGGEPLLQKEFDKLLDKIEEQGNPNCVLNVVTNLMVDSSRLESYVNRFKKILAAKKLKRIDITCSIDCWGEQQEYVRWGLKLIPWEKNFNYLLQQKWLYLNINQTITPLTIKTMPELLNRLRQWRQNRQVGHWFGTVAPTPSYMKSDIFGNTEFAQDAEIILKLMPTETDEDITTLEHMKSIFSQIASVTELDQAEIVKLITYLDEKDRRRGTDWELLFPWLLKYRKICGIAK